MATSFSLDRDKTLEYAPSDLRAGLAKLLEKIPSPKAGFFGDALWPKSKTSQWQIKCNEENYNFIKKLIAGSESGEKYSIGIFDYKIQFKKSRKKVEGLGIDAQSTRKQELASSWIMMRALRDNKKYNQYLDIKRDEKYQELLDIYPEVDDDEEWLKSFFLQQEKMLEEFSDSKFTEFSREGGFMEYITNLVNNKYGISRKDAWSPADIWLVQNESAVKSDIDSLVARTGETKSIDELNALLRTMFKQRRVVGISLKKISGNKARYEEVNTDDVTFDNDSKYRFQVISKKINLSVKTDKFGTQDSNISINGNNYGTIKFQIQGNITSSYSNLKWESTASGAAAARLGKAPVDMVISLLKQYGLSFDNNHNSYPKTVAQFNNQTTKYTNMFEELRNKRFELAVTSSSKFIENINTVLLSRAPHVANSKLMQLTFLHELSKLSGDKLNFFMTDLTFISMKKGPKFGPFGKLF